MGLTWCLNHCWVTVSPKRLLRLTKTGGAVAYMNNEPPAMDDIVQRNIRAEFLHHRADGEMLTKIGRSLSKRKDNSAKNYGTAARRSPGRPSSIRTGAYPR